MWMRFFPFSFLPLLEREYLLFVHKALEYFTCHCLKWTCAHVIFLVFVRKLWYGNMVELSLSALKFHCYESNNTAHMNWSWSCSFDLSSIGARRTQTHTALKIISMLLQLYPFLSFNSDWNDAITKLQPIKGCLRWERCDLAWVCRGAIFHSIYFNYIPIIWYPDLR